MQELSEPQFRQWRATLTAALRSFHTLCQRHGLTYYAAGGTAIGAVRHHGIIPWDDDIDLAMPRPDYDRLVELSRHEDLAPYELVTPGSRASYNCAFAKYCDTRTTLLERADTPCVIGLYIDVFPLDATSDDDREAARLTRRYRKLRNRLEAISTRLTPAAYWRLLLTPHEWGRFAIKTVATLLPDTTRNCLLRAMESISRRYAWGTTNHVTCYGGAYGMRERYPAEWLEGVAPLVPFEDTETHLLPRYELLLSQLYGDYMTPPPADAQHPKHLKAFFDLDSRRTADYVLGHVCGG